MTRILLVLDKESFLEIANLLKREKKEPSKQRRLVLYVAGGVLAAAVVFGLPYFIGSLRQTAAQNQSKELQLTELIREVKQQIIEASRQAAASGEDPLLKLKDVDLEINYTVKVSGTTSGKAEFYVLTADNSSQTDLQTAQRIVLHLGAIENFENKIIPADKPIEGDQKDTVTHDPTPPPKRKQK